eukprot:SAG11_NODE_320_length_10806_cov_17.415896_7_plen_120_part_00
MRRPLVLQACFEPSIFSKRKEAGTNVVIHRSLRGGDGGGGGDSAPQADGGFRRCTMVGINHKICPLLPLGCLSVPAAVHLDVQLGSKQCKVAAIFAADEREAPWSPPTVIATSAHAVEL